MRTPRYLFALVAAAGFMTAWLVPHDWLAYVLGTSLFLTTLFGMLGAVGARGEAPRGGLGVFSWLLIGTDRPQAEVTDRQAMRLFWMAVTYLVAFGAGAFAAVRG